MTPDMLARAGEALRHGEDWRRPLARLLGPHHPAGPRNEIDPRMVSRWASGAMEIPDWVPEVLARLTRETGERLLDVADELDAEAEPRPRI
ncbi:hypothetical protein MEX01_23960 [Methylorubrum extorquens]|uniref:hypothetical protein n=1 Tax=Methylorubrum extorquens TaxID=408 RepID=UPI00116F6CFB|nr:hypothetical protein [Methylorubrum extorquens]GEL41805.1 hypothetical protein MEX01_23960 [Methylorubrum extorquens]